MPVAQKQPSMRQKVNESVEVVRQRIKEMIRIQQREPLDNKINEMLKEVVKTKKIIQTLFKGAGRSFGLGLGGIRRAGLSLAKGLLLK